MRDIPTSRLEEWKARGFHPENCPVRQVLDHVAAKWTVLVLLELERGPRRFNVLGRALPDISKRMLTQSLRGLERDGLVRRRVFDTKPPSVEYALTDLGRAMLDPLGALVAWAEARMPEIEAARRTFDAAE
ncbi:winged helix-turn-helix transcriptional regulator [Celeribacter indicus]|uniref:Putative transcriptional regulator n=1 Tax=Celeribacter indicus TaxID=1208324 RepID=A0A0B5E3S4_9RHOB|nr:helix-turn-helix domain-containing protein [Celeribacter indicus]AJE48025.1 putative transcriptional regulator [Celeribacter indicus]SDW29830.1 transcriptional regulator, HxlR family [Celeribacter indicus]